MRLVYEDLARSYLEILQAKLRNFTVGHEFLDTWVPEEDAARSLYGVFEAAALARLKEPLTVSVSAATLKGLDRAALDARLKGLGALTATASPAGVEFTMTFSTSVANAIRDQGPQSRAQNADPRRAALKPEGGNRFVAVHGIGELDALTSPYHAAITAAAKAPAREGFLAAPSGTTIYEAADSGVLLSVAVDKDGLVAAARHSGAKPAWKGVLDALCLALEGRTLQEGAEHGLIRVMESLRDRTLAVAVPGILTPDNADPVFLLPQKLVRAIFRDWAKATGWKPEWNFWDDGPQAAWKSLPEAEKLSRARGAMKDCCRALGLQEDAEVVGVLGDVRLVLHFVQDKAKPSFAKGMIELERRLKKSLDPRLELQLEGIEDRNTRIQRTGRSAGGPTQPQSKDRP